MVLTYYDPILGFSFTVIADIRAAVKLVVQYHGHRKKAYVSRTVETVEYYLAYDDY